MAAKEKTSSRWTAWLAPILFLLAAVVAAGPASALTCGALQTRPWEKTSSPPESRPVDSLQLLNLHQQNESGGYDSQLESPLAAENTVPTIESAIQTPINPEIPGRPDPAWSIDTSTFTQGEATANGGIRNNVEFWQQWMQLQPKSISPSNAFRIQELELSPKIDQTWINCFPEHAEYFGETLVHHHVGQGPFAIPVPASTHIGFGPPWH